MLPPGQQRAHVCRLKHVLGARRSLETTAHQGHTWLPRLQASHSRAGRHLQPLLPLPGGSGQGAPTESLASLLCGQEGRQHLERAVLKTFPKQPLECSQISNGESAGV